MKLKFLMCEICNGEGGWVEVIDYWIGGPHYACQMCNQTGYLTLDVWLMLKLSSRLSFITDRYFNWRYNR